MDSSGKYIYEVNYMGLLLYNGIMGSEIILNTPVYQIFTKFSHFDNLFKHQSLFVSEITELKYILHMIISKVFMFR